MPCDYKNYPLNWFTCIRPAILARAKHCCEECLVPNYSIITRFDRTGMRRCNTYAEARQELANMHPNDRDCDLIIIVLTIAHLDHYPMNNDPRNLKALCQKCHNTLDAKHRAKTRRKKRLEALEKISPSLPLVTSIIEKI